MGSALGERFASLGWKLHLVTRSKRPYQMAFPCEQFVWDGTSIPLKAIEGVQAVINLAGESIFDNRWTADYKKMILDSRLFAGRALVAHRTNLYLALRSKNPLIQFFLKTFSQHLFPEIDVPVRRAFPVGEQRPSGPAE